MKENDMPIDRGDGRHWCDPAAEQPNAKGTWKCRCKQVWRLDPDSVWRKAEDDMPEPEPVQPDPPKKKRTTKTASAAKES